MVEEWKPIKDYEGLYEISSNGRVKSLNYNKTGREQILKPIKNRFGYLQIILNQNGKKKHFSVHRLVAQAFISNIENKPCINHKDEDKTNNKVENLEWCTVSYNNNYGTRNKQVSKALKGRKHSQEWIEKATKARIYKKLSQETIEKISKSKKGKKQSQETIEKIGKALKGKLKGRKQSKEHIENRAKALSIPIVQLTKNGEYIATYKSATQVKKELGFHNSHIIGCCKGKRKTHKGYKWMYLSDYKKQVS